MSLQKMYLLFPFSSRLMGTTIGSGIVSFKPAALHTYFPKSSSVSGVMDKIVSLVLSTVPLGNLQVTSGGGNPWTGQHMVVCTPREALWFVLGHETLLLKRALCSKKKRNQVNKNIVCNRNITYNLNSFDH